ncbi:MAG: hypothetical protein WCG27_00750, partial [Pseudomonadota bacterium]
MSRIIFVLTLILILVGPSCSKQEFATSPSKSTFSTSPVQTYSSVDCARFSTIKPKVDFLFLWGNSPSETYYMTDQLKSAFSNIVNSISANFDYRILAVPLVGGNIDPANRSTGFLLASDPTGLSASALGMLVPQSEAAERLWGFSNIAGYSQERGVRHSLELLQQNTGTGPNVFRPNSYTIVVLMSNGNDTSWTTSYWSDYGETQYFQGTVLPQFQAFKLSTLHPQQLRFMSLVAYRDSCNTAGDFRGSGYWKMSKYLYDDNSPALTDQAGKVWPDSYDLCGADWSLIFNGINNSIHSIIEAHKYNYWPVRAATCTGVPSGSCNVNSPIPPFDNRFVNVFKHTANITQQIPNDAANGFTYVGCCNNYNTRYAPTVGEPFTGYMIRLNGNAKVEYPSCVTVKTETQQECYGWVHLESKPVPSSVKLYINGTEISQSASNGWQFVDALQSNLDIKVQCVGDPFNSNAVPEIHSGYFLQLNG